ncbi:MAG TPA: alpha/beta hydrolase [Rhizomicrobium sp.]|nr:alpha/beta hydrolase [Rhizomicrobium sp.]
MSLQLFVADYVVRRQMKRRFAKNASVMTLRDIMEEMAAQAKPPPRHIRMDRLSLGGIMTERLRSEHADERKALLYIHGGGFVAGHPVNHRPLTWRLAAKTNAPVYAIDYRLAPEHPFPAALDDCLTAYRTLLDKGVKPERLAVGGDSAGGNLTLALALRLKETDMPQPAALVCLSPVTDLAEPAPSHADNMESDAMFDPRMFPSVPAAYCPGGDVLNPLISPLRGDVSGLPPTLFQCSREEMLRDDSVRMAERMRAAGIEATLEVWPKVFHVWQVAADVLPEGREAINNIAAFLNHRLR